MTKRDDDAMPRALRRLSLGMSMAMAASDLLQKEVAAICGISTAYLSKMLSGQKNPSQVVLDRFAAALGRRVGEIYDLGDQALERREVATREAAERRAADEKTVESIVEVADHLGSEELARLRDEMDRLIAERDAARAVGGASA